VKRCGKLVITLFERSTEALERRLARLPVQADLVELRLDALRDPRPELLIPQARRPVIATCRPVAAGGGWSGGEELRGALLQRAAAAGAAYVDVEWGSALASVRFGAARRIVSLHLDYTPAAAELLALTEKLRTGADLAKLVPLARSTADLATTLDWMRRCGKSLRRWIGFAAGAAGQPSRYLAPALGSWATYASAPGGRPAAAGQLSWELLTKWFSMERLRSARRFYAIAGRPVGHSLSPQIHNRLLSRFKLPAIYLPLEVDSAADLAALARGLPFDGISVTVPLKEQVIPHLDRLTARAARLGAVNTVLRRGRSLVGDNTDAEAIAAAVAARRRIRGSRVLVLGAGGSGRAAAAALSAAGGRVIICNRTEERARRVAASFDCAWAPWSRRSRIDADIVINTTTLGLTNRRLPLTAAAALRRRLVVDLVYRHGRATDWIRHARRCGATAVDGREILLRQAVEQFRLFTGKRVRWSALRALLE
jgi:3-dehydroquinate dehydratase/shikimate dehydrogenase